jgi:uncharacterized membrane protein
MMARTGRLTRLVRARPWLFVVTGVALAVGLFLPTTVTDVAVTRWLIAWNTGTLVYVSLAAIMMVRSSHDHMRQRAALHDDGQLAILGVVVVAAIASLAAIAGELALVPRLQGLTRVAHVVLAGVTLLSSWAFIQVMFALHYAHEYYATLVEGGRPALDFPGDERPDYGDFFYFAAIIGTSGQTADVALVSNTMRRIGTVHCILAYLFNTTVLAMLINIGAGLVQT